MTSASRPEWYLARIWIDRQASVAAIASGCAVLAKLRQDDAECEELFESLRAGEVRIEDVLAEIGDA